MENSGNIFTESLENNITQSNVEENKGQVAFVIEVNHDMKEVLEQPTSTITTTKQKRGGFMCCILFCYNNSKVNKGLSVNVILKEPVFRKKWLHMIYRKTLIQLLVIVFPQSILLVGKRHMKTKFLR